MYMYIHMHIWTVQLTHPNIRNEIGQCISEVCVVPEDMVGEQRRDSVATDSCIEHQDQYTDV